MVHHKASGIQAVILERHLNPTTAFLNFLQPFSTRVWLWLVGFHFIFGLSLKMVSLLKTRTNIKSSIKEEPEKKLAAS